MKRISRIFLIALIAALLQSCENVFHNDELDFMWRLDSVEYIDGVDFDGNTCSVESKEGLWLSFARDLVKIDDRNSYFRAIGILTDKGRQLDFDFSMYQEQDWPKIDSVLKSMGIDAKVSSFNITELNRKNLVLTGSKTILKLTKW